MKISVALAGNPNCGKTTLFNNLTGMRRHVGNWPGKTVVIERKEGKASLDGYEFEIIDLPGTYSLSGRSMEEKTACEFIENETPDIIINVVDASRLERNLYLTLQLIETGRPVIVALNMNKYAAAEGIIVNEKRLSEMLGVPVIKIEAPNAGQKDGLLKAIIHAKEKSNPQKSKFTENDISDFAERRYSLIEDIVNASVETINSSKEDLTDKIDRVVTNKLLGFPIFFAVMFLVFQIVFALGAPAADLLDNMFEALKTAASAGLAGFGAPDWVLSLVSDGILGGVGSVVSFLPNIVLMFLLLAVLEQSGYMARIAVLADRIMQKAGLAGKSFIPMILGFGCSVPAIMGARTLETKRERNLTILLTPFMSCSAKLPVYILFTGVFFAPEFRGVVMFSLYILGILVALVAGLILSKTVFKGEETAFTIEMPQYRIPNIKGLVLQMWDNAAEFLKHAGVIIFPAVLFVWLLASLPFGVEYGSSESVIGIMGGFVAPLFAPLGFGFAEAGVSLIMGVLAKEVVIGSFATLYGTAEAGVGEVLSSVFTPLSAYSFMVFVLLYIPCFASLAAIRKETNSTRFMLCSGGFYFAVAWIISFIVYRGGMLLGF